MWSIPMADNRTRSNMWWSEGCHGRDLQTSLQSLIFQGNPRRGVRESNRQATTRLNNAGRIVLSRQSDTRVVAIILLNVNQILFQVSTTAFHSEVFAQHPGYCFRIDRVLLFEYPRGQAFHRILINNFDRSL